MPLVPIDLRQSVGEEQRAAIGDIVYHMMVDVLNAPVGDKFHIITAHDSDALRVDCT
jgi:hypothetical protein